eukprot:m.339679 g.339679  ORF g.339679 m.339679 type:complete len:87 (-) comp18909_c0_seq1:427-687(-)
MRAYATACCCAQCKHQGNLYEFQLGDLSMPSSIPVLSIQPGKMCFVDACKLQLEAVRRQNKTSCLPFRKLTVIMHGSGSLTDYLNI